MSMCSMWPKSDRPCPLRGYVPKITYDYRIPTQWPHSGDGHHILYIEPLQYMVKMKAHYLANYYAFPVSAVSSFQGNVSFPE